MSYNIYSLAPFYLDSAEPNQLDFQDVGSPIGEQLVFFHDNLMFVILLICVVIGWLIFIAVTNNVFYRYLIEGTLIEIVWTLIPAIVLLSIAFPSLQLLYSMDEVIEPSLTIKAVGHQWYWSYEYSDIEGDSIEFDSYMIPTSDLSLGDLSLLEVDSSVVLPVNTQVSVVITGADVIHCFAVPSLGVKTDAVPGSLNQVGLLINSPGVYYGQCSEICGSDHSFMPIVIEGVSQEKFINWMVINNSEV